MITIKLINNLNIVHKHKSGNQDDITAQISQNSFTKIGNMATNSFMTNHRRVLS